MTVKPIRADEWKAELERVMLAASDEGLTLLELAEHLGLSDRTTRKRLYLMARAGRLAAGRRNVTGLDGIVRPVPVYRIKAKEVP